MRERIKRRRRILDHEREQALDCWNAGYAYKPIARALKCSPRAIEALVHRARKRGDPRATYRYGIQTTPQIEASPQ